MAGDWIKVRVNIADDPAVIGMAARTGLDEFAVVGRLVHLWSWADSQSRDGNVKGVTADWINRKIQQPGFAQAMAEFAWIEIHSDGVTFPNFERHNGNNAKSRALGNERQKEKRSRDATATKSTPAALPASRSQRDNSVTREEEEKNKGNTHTTTPPAAHSDAREKTVCVRSASESEAMEACAALASSGMRGIKPNNKSLCALIAAGAGPEDWEAAGLHATSANKGFDYALGVVKKRLADRAQLPGPAPASSVAWDRSRSSIEATGERLGLGRWDENAFGTGRGESFPTYRERVRERAAMEVAP